MGEVYAARDERLDRRVAVKVLPAELADDERLRRFEREARAASALNHPNILTVHDVGQHGGVPYLVSELLEGETLRARLAGGALPTRKTIEVAAQIARGLAAAHERGIVHRDLKPENVFVTDDGRVKILDFGLAKLTGSEQAQALPAEAPTERASTASGTILGTVGYMAPEQVRGLPVDHRADLFALGAILYEMLCGRRAFARDSVADTMSAILRDEPPPLAESGHQVPPALERLVAHCLEKNPAERFRSAHDLAFDLEAAAGLTSTASGAQAPREEIPPRWWTRREAWAAAAGLAGLLLGALLAGVISPRTTAVSPPRLSFRQLTKLPGQEAMPSLSPDGESFVFVKEVDGRQHLLLQRVDGHNAIDLTKDSPADNSEPAFSPDGRLIAFRSERGGGGIFVMGATGESVRRVTDWGFGPAWSADGSELAVAEKRFGLPWGRPPGDSRLWAVRVDTGKRRLLTEQDAVQPSWSPNGRRVAFWGLRAGTFERDLWTVAADGSTAGKGQARAVTTDPELDWNPAWSADGRHLYFSSSRGGTMNLWRVPMEEATGEPRGRPEALTVPSSWAGWVSVARSGRQLVFVDRNVRDVLLRAPFDPARNVLAGPPERIFQGSLELFDQALSPDGQALVFSNAELHQHLFYLRADGSELRQLTDGPYRDRFASFAPDGRTIAFQTTRFAGRDCALIGADGSGLRPLFGATSIRASDLVWSPDGRRMAVGDEGGGRLCEVASGACERLRVPAAAGGRRRSTSPEVFFPAGWSADGHLLVGATSGALGNLAIYSLPQRRIIARGPPAGGPPSRFVRFLPDGRHLALLSRGEPPARRSSSAPARTPTLFDDAAAGVVLLDLGLRTIGTIYDPPGDPLLRSLSLSRDGRWLSFIERANESDIWLISLEEEPPP